MKLFFDDQNFDGQCSAVSGRPTPAWPMSVSAWRSRPRSPTVDRDSWYRAWSEFGLPTARTGRPPSPRGTGSAPVEQYLRATEYLRQAFFFHRENLDGNELRAGLFRRASPAFRARRCRCLDPPGGGVDRRH